MNHLRDFIEKTEEYKLMENSSSLRAVESTKYKLTIIERLIQPVYKNKLISPTYSLINTSKALCLLPLVQTRLDLYNHFDFFNKCTPKAIIIAMEVAKLRIKFSQNSLKKQITTNIDKYTSLIPDINAVLIADTIYLKYSPQTLDHTIQCYCDPFLSILEISEEQYQSLIEFIK